MSLKRNGSILGAVLITIFVVMLFSLGLVRAVVMHHRQMGLAEQRQQALWLAESALQRAAAALDENPNYSGETWRVSFDLPNGSPGVAVIRVHEPPEPGGSRLIDVEVTYPENATLRCLEQRQMVVNSTFSPGN